MTRLKSSLLKGLGERFHGRQGAAPLLRRSERELQGKDLRGSPYAVPDGSAWDRSHRIDGELKRPPRGKGNNRTPAAQRRPGLVAGLSPAAAAGRN
jgi:hypothetical protein